jgi:hypothetical protein
MGACVLVCMHGVCACVCTGYLFLVLPPLLLPLHHCVTRPHHRYHPSPLIACTNDPSSAPVCVCCACVRVCAWPCVFPLCVFLLSPPPLPSSAPVCVSVCVCVCVRGLACFPTPQVGPRLPKGALKHEALRLRRAGVFPPASGNPNLCLSLSTPPLRVQCSPTPLSHCSGARGGRVPGCTAWCQAVLCCWLSPREFRSAQPT